MNNTPSQIKLSATITEDYANLRVDQALAKLFPEFSRGRLQNFIREGMVIVNGTRIRPKDKVKSGDEIIINAVIEANEAWQPESIALDIIYEDDQIIVLNKPAGLVVHPAAGNKAGTLLNALLHHAPELGELPRAGIIHRLDKDTSGIMVVTRTLKAHHFLVKALQARTIKREYRAIVVGQMTAGGTVEAPIGRHPKVRTKMAVVASGKPAMTHYRVLERFPAHSFIKVMLETGRTHQIRVHMAHIHYPIVGDSNYGGRLYIPKGASAALRSCLQAFKRQALHAFRLELPHPTSREPMAWTAPIPDDMHSLLELLRQE